MPRLGHRCRYAVELMPMETRIPNFVAESYGELIDFNFFVVESSTSSSGSFSFTLHADWRNEKVGFNLELPSTWQSGLGIVRFLSLGDISDRMLLALNDTFATNLSPSTMAGSVTFAAQILDGDLANLTERPSRMKLFFDHDDDDRSAEIYLNLDPPARIAELCEKSDLCRSAMILAFSPTTSLPDQEMPCCAQCGQPLRTDKARQCFACGADWH